MAQSESISTRTSLAIAVAACSMTLAVGITTAALFGYVGAWRSAAGDGAQGTTDTRATDAATPAGAVVLVPVQPATGAPALEVNPGDPPDLVRASARHREHERHDDDEGEDD